MTIGTDPFGGMESSNNETSFSKAPGVNKRFLWFVPFSILTIVVGLLVSNQSLFEQPKDLEAFISKVRSATVTVFCERSSGSGWAIQLETLSGQDVDVNFPVAIITNHHVIEDCVSGGEIRISSPSFQGVANAYLREYDGTAHDIALLVTNQEMPSLRPSFDRPQIGNWSMAVGSPGTSNLSDGILAGNVTFGHVTNFAESLVATDAAVNYGNSGGPLVNSLGEVIGTTTWLDGSGLTDNIAYAQGTPVLCATILTCKIPLDW